MATILLTAVGGAIGGPIGAAIGAMAGQAIDAELFAPQARHGPRLGDLAVQTSSYGTPIPKLFGTMRVAGTVIWATDLEEHRTRSGGGKGRPKTVQYSYSASFAVALSARSIRAVRRIWADGKLLRGAAGDFKSETKFRLYLGSEDQAADPLIASIEGASGTPAYRGLAYAVFEDMQLADFGNRIPSLSFEVEADAGPVSISDIGERLSGGAIDAGPSPELAGYAASGDSIRGALEGLAGFVPLSLVEIAGQLLLTEPLGPAAIVEPAEENAEAGSGSDERSWRAAASLPNSVSISYADPARDFQTGMQRAFRPGPALVAEQRALPISIGAGVAKGLAEHRLAALWAARATATANLSLSSVELRPGRLVRFEGENGLWRIERWRLEQMVVRLELVRVVGTSTALRSATPGRPVTEADRRHGPTTLRLIELPSISGSPSDRPQLFAAAAGVEEDWRRAAVMASFDGGASWQELGQTAGPAVMGAVLDPLPWAGAAMLDEISGCTVQLLNGAMWLEGRDPAALANGANLALIGEELVQFGTAAPLGGGRFRLASFLRGRFGTEWAASAHHPGEPFVLLDPGALLPLDAPASSTGSQVRVVAAGLEDGPEGVPAERVVTGQALRPPEPVHLRAVRSGNGDLELSWVRRSRAGWAWSDGADVPLGEETERYQVTIVGAGFRREVSSGESRFTYSALLQAADGAAGTIDIEVVQLGTHAQSRPARLSFNL
jgi:hypothetical protein